LNFGGWLLMTILFSALMLVVQRTERKRRRLAAVIMIIVGITVWQYGVYALSRDCAWWWKPLCNTLVASQKLGSDAVWLVNMALLGAVVVNILYWAFLGRYNPPGSSDDIQVLGRDD
jgi:H+/Cl- antiporter ClcA